MALSDEAKLRLIEDYLPGLEQSEYMSSLLGDDDEHKLLVLQIQVLEQERDRLLEALGLEEYEEAIELRPRED